MLINYKTPSLGFERTRSADLLFIDFHNNQLKLHSTDQVSWEYNSSHNKTPVHLNTRPYTKETSIKLQNIDLTTWTELNCGSPV